MSEQEINPQAVAESVARTVTASTEARLSGPIDKVEAVVKRADTRIEKADQASRAILRLPLAAAGFVVLLAVLASYLVWRAAQSGAEFLEQRKENAALAPEILRAKLLEEAAVTSGNASSTCPPRASVPRQRKADRGLSSRRGSSLLAPTRPRLFPGHVPASLPLPGRRSGTI